MNDQPVQPDSQYIIEALQEELTAAHANRLYLLSVLKQVQAEFKDERALWQIEKQSMLANKYNTGEGK